MSKKANSKQPIPRRTLLDFAPTKEPVVREGRIIGDHCTILSTLPDGDPQAGVYCGERFIPLVGDRTVVKTELSVRFVEPSRVIFEQPEGEDE